MWEMPLLKMWSQPEVQGFLKPGLAEVKKQWEQLMSQARAAHEAGHLPFAPEELLKLRLNGLSVALTGFKVDVDDAGEPVPSVGIVLHANFGESTPSWRKIIEFGLQKLEAEAGDKLVKSSSTPDILTWKPKIPGPIGLNIVWLPDGVLIGSLTHEVGATLRALKSDESDKKLLTASPNWTRVASHLDRGDAEVELFFNYEELYGSIMSLLRTASENAPEFPKELDIDKLDRALTALGVKSIKSLGVTSTYKDGKSVNKSYVYSPVPSRTGLFAGGTKTLDLDFLQWIPESAASVSAGTFDFMAIYDGVVGALKAYDEELASEILGKLAEAEKQVGLSLKEDLFGAFGHQMVSFARPLSSATMMGGGFMNGTILIQIKDQARLLKSLGVAKQLSQGYLEVEESERRGIKRWNVRLTEDPFRGELPVDITTMLVPTFSFEQGYMVLAFSKEEVEKTVKAMKVTPTGEDVRKNASFQALLASLPKQGLTGLSFADHGASLDSVYNMAYGFSYLVDESIPLDVSALPDDGKFLTSHLFPSTSYTTSDGNGFSSHHVGPFGPELGALIVGTAGVGLGVAGVMWRREHQARRVDEQDKDK
jgi:hypothetical protein